MPSQHCALEGEGVSRLVLPEHIGTSEAAIPRNGNPFNVYVLPSCGMCVCVCTCIFPEMEWTLYVCVFNVGINDSSVYHHYCEEH